MVVESLAAGLAPKQIASREGVSVAATRKHIVAAKRKAGARTLAELSALTARADANKFGMTGANVDYSMGQPAPETGHHSPGERLTSRQREVVALLADGLRYREIAQRLDLSERQVGRHVANAIERLGVVSAAELVAVVSVGALRSRDRRDKAERTRAIAQQRNAVGKDDGPEACRRI